MCLSNSLHVLCKLLHKLHKVGSIAIAPSHLSLSVPNWFPIHNQILEVQSKCVSSRNLTNTIFFRENNEFEVDESLTGDQIDQNISWLCVERNSFHVLWNSKGLVPHQREMNPSQVFSLSSINL